MKPCHSIWLMPCDEDLALFSGIVEHLAAGFGTPRFMPHLTLVEDMPRPAAELSALLERDFDGCTVVEAPVSAVGGLPLYYRSLFAAFAPAGRLQGLKQTSIDTFGCGDIASFMPHISLAYGVAEAKKADAIARLGKELAGRVVRFDSIAVAASGQTIAIDEWKIVHRLRLV